MASEATWGGVRRESEKGVSGGKVRGFYIDIGGSDQVVGAANDGNGILALLVHLA